LQILVGPHKGDKYKGRTEYISSNIQGQV